MANKMLFKAAMERQNAAVRALLKLRTAIVQDLRKTIPQMEKEQTKTGSVCVVVSLQELCAVQSLDADDYRIRTHVNLICESLMSCRTADDLLRTVQGYVQSGKVWNGRRFLAINRHTLNTLCQYSAIFTEYGVKPLALAIGSSSVEGGWSYNG